MLAQFLYDLREEYGFCSGNDLHRFFEKETGEPSPSGYAEIDGVAAREFIKEQLSQMESRSPDVVAEMLEQAHGAVRMASYIIP